MCTSHPRVNRWYLKFAPNCYDQTVYLNLIIFFSFQKVEGYDRLYLLYLLVLAFFHLHTLYSIQFRLFGLCK